VCFFGIANNRSYFLGKIIPYRGSWVEFEYDTKNILYVRIDRKRNFWARFFSARWGMKSTKTFWRTFTRWSGFRCATKTCSGTFLAGLVDRKLTHEIRNPKSDEVIVGAHKRINENLFQRK